MLCHAPASPRPHVTRSLRGYGLLIALAALWLGSVVGALWLNNLLAWNCGLIYISYDTWLIAYVAWKTWDLPRLAEASAPTGARPTLAVIVPARNEARVLPATLDALLAQSDLPEQILVVNDGSTDDTAAVLQQRYALPPAAEGLFVSSGNPRLQVLHKRNSGKADSMNQAVKLLEADVIVTLDADTRLQGDAVARLREAFQREPQLAAACGVLTPRCDGGGWARMFEWFQTFEYLRAFLSRAAWMRSNALLLVSGAFAGYRREVLNTLGGYDHESLVEDYELIHRLHRYAHEHALDWRVRVIAGARADTEAPAGLRAFLHQRRRWFAGFLHTQFAYRRMHGDPRYGAVGTLMLPVKAADTLQPLFGLTAFALIGVFIARGAHFVPLVLAVMGGKLLIDFCYHLWAVGLYHRWLKIPPPRGIWRSAALATLAEPFSFQLARHTGALWGWIILITGRQDWAPQRGEPSDWETT